jgi:hypothetical protein
MNHAELRDKFNEISKDFAARSLAAHTAAQDDKSNIPNII